MIDLLLLGIAAFAAIIAALFACLTFFLRKPSTMNDLLTREVVAQLVRSECEIVRKAGEDQAHGLRQELTDSLRTFQDGMIGAIRTLNEFIRSQIQDFGSRLDIGTQLIDKRV